MLHAVGGIEDHLHVVVSIPPALAVATCVKHFKGTSARHVNQASRVAGEFGWQAQYGVLTVTERVLPRVADYVVHQREHHRNNTLIAWYERTAEGEDA